MTTELEKYIDIVQGYIKNTYKRNFRDPNGKLKHPFFVPGSSYAYELWDWDSWLTDIALREISDDENILIYEQGCILNFLEHSDKDGRIPINIKANTESIFDLVPGKETNIHKPCLAQHALLISEGGDVEWLRDKFFVLEKFMDFYEMNCKHEESGLYFWINDFAIGVDNEPCTFYRPDKSTGSIFLNSLMYAELISISKLAEMLRKPESQSKYISRAERLKTAIQSECWDERDGFFYSADLNLKSIDPNEWLHSGSPRHWKTLPMRIGVWTGFLAMWNGIATKEQADRMVKEHYLNEKTFNSDYGVCSLSRMEKMYAVKKSGNPSCWIGPIWGNANYMVFEGLLKYGYIDEAKRLAEKTVILFGRDIESCGEMHEYYSPETGEGVNNKGFQSWNLLAYNLSNWLKSNY